MHAHASVSENTGDLKADTDHGQVVTMVKVVENAK